MKQTLLLITAVLVFGNIFAQDCNLNEEAKKHIGRAEGFRAVAEKEEDYLDVFNEYYKAFNYAPNCPDICYNLACCAEMLCKLNPQNCVSAISWYKKYLEMNPNDPDRDNVEIKIYTVQAMKEKYDKRNLEEKIKQNNLKEMEKWVGSWYTNGLYINFEIYLDNEKLKARIIGDNYNVKPITEICSVDIINNNVITFDITFSSPDKASSTVNMECHFISTQKIEVLLDNKGYKFPFYRK